LLLQKQLVATTTELLRTAMLPGTRKAQREVEREAAPPQA
jgi:hypothetical protein